MLFDKYMRKFLQLNNNQMGISRDQNYDLDTTNMIFNSYTGSVPLVTAYPNGDMLRDHTETVLYPATATNIKVISTSNQDAFGTGSGMWLVMILGLGENGEQIIELVLTGGTTPVQTIQKFSRINRALVILGSSPLCPVGTVYFGSGDIVAGKPQYVYGIMNPGIGQIRQARISTPAGFHALLSSGLVSSGKGKEVYFDVRMRLAGDLCFTSIFNFVNLQQTFDISLAIPQILTENIDFEIWASTTVASVNASYLGGFILIKRHLMGGFI